MSEKECDCNPFQCCEKCMDKFEFTGKHILEPIWVDLIRYLQLVKAMEKAAKKWGSGLR